jgi:hypothetical protein
VSNSKTYIALLFLFKRYRLIYKNITKIENIKEAVNFNVAFFLIDISKIPRHSKYSNKDPSLLK